jgi:DNA-binding response OmpR family regulator
VSLELNGSDATDASAGQRTSDDVVTVLAVDDEPALHEMLTTALAARFRVQSATNVSDALAKWRAARPDVLLLDLGLGEGSGIEVIVEVRKTSDTPVIVVTGDSRADSTVLALRLGADDYVVKPFDVHAMEARIDAVLRRASRSTERDAISRFDELAIDVRARQVFVHDELVSLTATEFDLLAFLAAQPRQAFTREQLLDAVWRSSSEWQTVATVTEHTRRLRVKLGPAARHVGTVYGRGYRFDP